MARWQSDNKVSCQVTVGVGVTGIHVSSTVTLRKARVPLHCCPCFCQRSSAADQGVRWSAPPLVVQFTISSASSNTVAPCVRLRLSCPNCKIQNVGFGLFSHSRNTWNIHEQCGALRVPEICAVSVTSGGTGAEHRPEILEANGMNSRIQGARTRTQPSKFDVASVLICQSQRTNLGNELHVLQLRHLGDGLQQQCLGLLNEHLVALVRRIRQTHDDGSVFRIGHLASTWPNSGTSSSLSRTSTQTST